MNTIFVVTLIGEERPGVIAHVSEKVASHKGRWLKSEFHSLEGRFAGIIEIEVPATDSCSLREELEALEGSRLRLLIAEPGAVDNESRYPLTLRFVGLDRRNIISDISTVLSRNGVTVLSLNSQCTPAPMSSEQLFEAEFQLEAPVSVSSDLICESLEALTPELMVDIEPEASQLPFCPADNSTVSSQLSIW